MKQRSVKKLSLIVGLLVVAAASVWLTFFFQRTDKELRNIILISIDTIRADHLSSYGYQHKTTPRIDAFAENAVLFENCFANIPLTLPSHATMLTGLIPPSHGVQDNLSMSLSDSVLTLPEILQTQGYATYGIISADVLNKRYGLDQGFDVYNDTFEDETSKAEMVPQRFADQTASHAMKWLQENQDKKKFMFIHFYDPHTDYTPPAPFDKQFKRPYDGEIAFVDHCIGQIIDKLESLGLYDDSLIIITGDHAELLGEHGETTHGFFIYHNVLRVPLIVKPAGHSRSVKVADNTSLIDIAPTILAQTGIDINVHMEGIDLSEYFIKDDHHVSDRDIFNESLTATKYRGNSLLGVINDQWHYIQTTQPELYNFKDDPEELNNLIDKQPQRARILQDKLSQILESSVRRGNESGIELDYQSRQAIESLGYVSGSVDSSLKFDQDKENPKTLLNVHNDLQHVLTLSYDEEYDQAIKLCNRIIAQRPDIGPTYELLADIYIKQEAFDKAIEAIQKKLDLMPNDIATLKFIAETHNLAENYPKALEYIDKVLQLEPGEVEAIRKLANIHVKLKSYDKAIDAMDKRLSLLPDDIATLKFLAETHRLAEDYTEAIKYIDMILKQEPDVAQTYFYLARNYQSLKENEKALENYLKALQLQENYLPARINAAEICEKMGKTKQAVEHYEIALELEPKLAFKHNTVAWIQAARKDPQLHNPASALAHAQKAVEIARDKDSPAHKYYPHFLDTLAVAQSASGQFEAAINTATLAVKVCRERNLTSEADEIQKRIELYKQHKAYRE